MAMNVHDVTQGGFNDNPTRTVGGLEEVGCISRTRRWLGTRQGNPITGLNQQKIRWPEIREPV